MKDRKKRYYKDFFSYMLIMIVLFTAWDLIKDIRTESSAYEVRYEADETFATRGNLYRLYINDKYCCDIDYNRYSITDDNGNTDYKYCTLINDASNLTYTIILCAMFFIVISIAENSYNGTPFTKKNIDLVKVISLLQLALAILPGLVRFVLSLVKFNYYSSSFDITTVDMIAIAFVIGLIAFIFRKGLALQEDVDSIA